MSDPKDLSKYPYPSGEYVPFDFNVKAVDEFVSSENDKFENRKGKDSLTISGIAKYADPGLSAQFALQAEAARDAAVLAAGVYPDTSTIINGGAGFPPVQEGHFASVPSPENENFLDLYKVIDGNAALIGGYPSANYVKQVEQKTSQKQNIQRVILSPDDNFSTEYKEIDSNMNIVGGPSAMLYLLENQGGGGNEEFTPPAQTLYVDSAGLKTRIAQQFSVVAKSPSPDYSIQTEQPFWFKKGAVVNTNRSTIIGNTPSVVLPRGNSYVGSEMIIPSADNLLILIPAFGQSNSVGAQSYVPDEIMTDNKWKDRMLMPSGTGFIDVRLNLPSGRETVGAETVFNPATINGFKPLISMQSELVPSQGETILEGIGFGLASELEINLGWVPRMCFFTAGWGGRYQSQLAKGTIPYNNLMTAIARIKVLAEARGWRVWVPGIALVNGESDSIRPSYIDSIRTWQADIETDVKAITGQSGGVPFFASQASTFSGSNTNGVMATYLGAKDTNSIFLTTPYYPYPLVNDLLHLGKSSVLVGEKIGHSIARFVSGFGVSEYGSVFPTSVTLTSGGGSVVIAFNVPKAPLVLDTTDEVVNSPTPDDYGFAVYDETDSEITISSVAASGSTVTINLASAITGGRVDYALKGFGATKVRGMQPRGCLRDSETIRFYYNNERAYNWCPHFSEVIA